MYPAHIVFPVIIASERPDIIKRRGLSSRLETRFYRTKVRKSGGATPLRAFSKLSDRRSIGPIQKGRWNNRFVQLVIWRVGALTIIRTTPLWAKSIYVALLLIPFFIPSLVNFNVLSIYTNFSKLSVYSRHTRVCARRWLMFIKSLNIVTRAHKVICHVKGDLRNYFTFWPMLNIKVNCKCLDRLRIGTNDL